MGPAVATRIRAVLPGIGAGSSTNAQIPISAVSAALFDGGVEFAERRSRVDL
jgi:hypothetical protein